MTEKQLIKRCSENDRVAQQTLYETYAPKMLGVCLRYVGDPVIAQDVMHDGFITVFSKIGSFRSEGSFEGWMRKIFVNTALGHLRKNKYADQMVSADETLVQLNSNEISAIENMENKQLLDCINELPDGYRIVLNLFAIEGYSHKEIAQILNINEGTSRSQYARAKIYLQKVLKQIGVNKR